MLWVRATACADDEETSAQLAGELRDVCRSIAEGARPLACLVLASDKGPFFVKPPESAEDCDANADAWREAIDAVARLEPPTVALLGGDAIGVAWELALASDLRIGSAATHVGSPEVGWGRLPSAGGTQRLVRVAGPTAAMRLLMLGEILAAGAALDLGLLHWVVQPSELSACSEALVADIARAAPLALAYTKEAVAGSADLPFDAGLRLEADLASLLQTTSDRVEGIAAFRERRPPRYRGQ